MATKVASFIWHFDTWSVPGLCAGFFWAIMLIFGGWWVYFLGAGGL